MNIQIDSKSILIILLLAFSLFFGYKWYFSMSDRKEWKNKVEQLNKENKALIDKRDSLQSSLNDLKIIYDDIVVKDSLLQIQISDLEKDIIDSKNKANRTVKELNKIKQELEENKRRIEELINNPIDKTDNELIESLKNKLKQ
jgi:predicted  nucleic acid-binding Zn-ribbon protein